MANSTGSFTTSQADNTSLRAWGAGIKAMFSAVGLVQTSDTGQADWTTISRTGSANALQGYEIWRFNDALQSTAPIYLRVNYRSGSFANIPGMTIEVGTGSNGSGTITGSIGTLSNLQCNNGSPGTLTSYMASDGSGLVFVHGIDAGPQTDYRTLYVLDRFRDSSGAALDDGVFMMSRAQNVTSSYIARDFNYSRTSTTTLLPAFVPITASGGFSSLDGGDVLTWPYTVVTPDVYSVKMALCYPVADLGAYSNQAVTHLGASRTFKSLGTQLTGSDMRAQSALGFLMWWSD